MGLAILKAAIEQNCEKNYYTSITDIQAAVTGHYSTIWHRESLSKAETATEHSLKTEKINDGHDDNSE